MLYSRTSGKDASPRALGSMRVHDGAEPERARFTARRIELLLAHRRSATVSDARRREDLDDIGAAIFLCAHESLDILDASRSNTDTVEGRENARSQESASCHGVADMLVDVGAKALYRGKARHQHRIGVLGRVERADFAGLIVVIVQPSVGIEMPADVHVGVDETGKDRQPRQVVRNCVGVAFEKTGDDAVDHDDVSILEHVPAPVDDTVRSQGQVECILARNNRGGGAE